ncbi:methyltransferase, putative, TIGR00027 family [Synechococcus sp. PCC 7335]|uniref:class I SAM-dependent methyltransferase n=1 Tax=Synechococcus sp. (strain ATCC 29403 / PCC 7335) TaxID=91464 RepID=UPI00017EE78A|nr:SAM-dependent methyltransferase [Synechococcus sp. PCC 7335]EDX84421.1 methyltransferase, putative, TIGR00027 family [Synechococcus sp. PCC 7335]
MNSTRRVGSTFIELLPEDSFLNKHFSITALVPLLVRWMMHWQGRRPDASAARLVQVLFGQSYSLLCAGMGPVLLAIGVADWLAIASPPKTSERTLASMLRDRTVFFDQALSVALVSVEQVVILGAGFDTRLYEYCRGRDLGLFEVDQIETQAVKKQALKQSGIDIGNVHFVTVNFADEDWMQGLISGGFNLGKRTFFLWEGVTYYLTKAEVEKGFALMNQVCGDGSAIAFDFFSEALVNDERTRLGTAVFNMIGEPLRFGLEVSKGVEAGLVDIIANTGLSLDKVQTIESWIGEKPEPAGRAASGLLSGNVLGGFATLKKDRKHKK